VYFERPADVECRLVRRCPNAPLVRRSSSKIVLTIARFTSALYAKLHNSPSMIVVIRRFTQTTLITVEISDYANYPVMSVIVTPATEK